MNLAHSLTLSAVLLGFFSSCSSKKEQVIEVPSSAPLDIVEAKKLPTIPDKITFNEHVQPILSEYCYHCHGPDSSSREPKKLPLRIDREEFAFLDRHGNGPVIVKGKPEESELIRLIKSPKTSEVMPPPEMHKTMNSQQIAIIEKWIEQGAEYEEHWSFIAPVKAKVPTSKHSWAKNPLDHFVAKKLESKGLTPNPEQNRARLLRRVTFDLIGLPPTPQKVEQFVADKRDTDTILKEEVDRLLETDAYAEHFARHWLDAARYADTHGIHIDNYRSIWPYRDWVIDAFKQNMPFDEFTIEQIAGDLLPKPNIDQLVATGFNRCLPTTGEGGAIVEEYEAIYAQDRTDTTSAIWLGLTTNCASCHDHKFDPITTEEVYQFTSFFRNTTMHAMDRNNAHHPPNIFVPAKKDRKAWATILKNIGASKLALANFKKTHQQDFHQWLKEEANKQKVNHVPTDAILNLPISKKAKQLIDTEGNKYKIHGKVKWIDGINNQALQFTNKSFVALGKVGNFERDQAFSYSAWIRSDHNFSGAVIAKMNRDNGHRGWDLWMQNGHACFHLINVWPHNFLKVRTAQKVPKNEWVHVTATYDGSSKSEGVRIYFNGIPQKLYLEGNQLTKSTKTTATLKLGERSSGQPFLNGAIQDFQLFDRKLSAQEVKALSKSNAINLLLKKSVDKIDQKQMALLETHYFETINKEYKVLQTEVTKLLSQKKVIEKNGDITLVMKEKDSKPFAYVLIRGEYGNKGQKVTPNTPAILPPMLDSQPKNRLGLAQWLVDKRNPLTARVTVNRYWYYFFGRGIVESTEDFGIMGGRPSHPELLDWLAVDFQEHDWDIHQLIRNIVLSATYRQSAIVDSKKRKADIDNILLSRGPRYRLDAEQIRDLALSSSGLLSHKVGGKPVKPYQPAGIWESVAMTQSNTRFYKEDKGKALYRRSLYTFWKRTAPHPSMEILNAPSREIFCVRRNITNTPLQAFVTMNDPQFVEATRALAEIALTKEQSFDGRLKFIAESLLGRKLKAGEANIVKTSLANTLAHYKAKPEQAKKLIHTGASKPSSKLDPSELAAWSLIASQIFNLDETLCK